jgi:hypothetical protein
MRGQAGGDIVKYQNGEQNHRLPNLDSDFCLPCHPLEFCCGTALPWPSSLGHFRSDGLYRTRHRALLDLATSVLRMWGKVLLLDIRSLAVGKQLPKLRNTCR